MTLTLDAATTGRNIILGYTTDKNKLPKQFSDLLSTTTGSAFDVNSYLAQSSVQQVYAQQSQFNYTDIMYIYVILTDPKDGFTYGYTVNENSSDTLSCPCSSSSVCSCSSHGIVQCNSGYIGNKCEQQATIITTQQTNYLIQSLQYFYFDASEENMAYNVGIIGLDNTVSFDLCVKFYTFNSSVLPYPSNSQIVTNLNQTSLSIIPNTALKNPPLYYNRVVMKLSNLNIQQFNVQFSLQVTNQSGGGNSNTTIVVILISVSAFVLILLFFAIVYIIKLNKRDRALIEQNRQQRQRNQQRLNTTMGDEDIKKYMPAVQYKDIKEQLLKVSKQEDVGVCVVCLCDFEDDENIRSTYCKHVFHSECLTDWMKKNESCPYCRTALNKNNIEETYDKHKSNSLMWLEQDKLVKDNQSEMKDQDQEQEDNQQKNEIICQNSNNNKIIIISNNNNNKRRDDEKEALQENLSQNSQIRRGRAAPESFENQSRKSQTNLQQQPSQTNIQESRSQNQIPIQSSQRSSMKQLTVLKNEEEDNILRTIQLEGNKEPRNEECYSPEKEQQQQSLASNRNQDVHNFQSSENMQTINKFNNESTDQGGQFMFMSSNHTPGRGDNSMTDYKRNMSSQYNDSFLNDGHVSSKRNIVINPAKNSKFKNNLSSDKKSFTSNDNDQDQSYNQDIKITGLDHNAFVDPDSIYDDQVQKINSDFIQSQSNTANFLRERQSEDIYNAEQKERKRNSALQVIYSEASSPTKLNKFTPYSFRMPQTTANKRKNNSKKNTLSQNSQISKIQQLEENKDLRGFLKDQPSKKK